MDNNNYTLMVTNNITSINVNATAEDEKSTVKGIGTHELQVGENNIEVIVTSESGAENKINIKVTRKDGYYLEDLQSVLKNNKLKDINIIINAESKITKEQIIEIKNSKKTISFNYYDENKKLIYSWLIDGAKIKDTKEIITTVTYTTENIKEIYKLSNYADGLYINFKHSGDLPNGTKIKLYVGDKFDNESIVNVYNYNNDKKTLDLVQDSLKVTDGYIQFGIEHCSEYFVTMSNLTNSNKSNSSKTIILVIISIIEFLAIISMLVIYILKIKKETKDKRNVFNETINIDNSSDFIDVSNK
ncbi:MAG: cadherin-like beta sandwich domain-containing protein [Firmicutes bacterium]|nr:cadherin-like beta sandwich domain-containing protein [Bacillota bacterium]